MRQDVIFFSVIFLLVIYCIFFYQPHHISFVTWFYWELRGYIKEFAERLAIQVDNAFGANEEL